MTEPLHPKAVAHKRCDTQPSYLVSFVLLDQELARLNYSAAFDVSRILRGRSEWHIDLGEGPNGNCVGRAQR